MDGDRIFICFYGGVRPVRSNTYIYIFSFTKRDDFA